MISELLVSNFKGFSGTHKVKLAPLTLIYGANSSGKSSLIKALGAINQSTPTSQFETLRSTGMKFNFYGQPIDLGGFKNSVFKQDSSKNLSLGLKLQFRYRPNSRLVLGMVDNFEYLVNFKWNERNKDSQIFSINVKINLNDGETIDLYFKKTPYAKNSDSDIGLGDSHLELTLDEDDAEVLAKYIMSVAEFQLSSSANNSRANRSAFSRERIIEEYKEILNRDVDDIKAELLRSHSENPALYKVNGFLLSPVLDRESFARDRRDGVYNFVQELITEVRQTTRVEIAGISYIGPMRYLPERMEQDIPNDNYRNISDGSDLVSTLANNDDLITEVNEWLDKLSIPYEINIGKIALQDKPSFGKYRTLILLDRRTKTTLSAKDIGFGVSQILPIIMSCLQKNKSCILIEQPELHIHPKLQLEIAELFVSSIKQTRPKQLIIETHSENLILRLIKKIREGQLSSDEVSVIYVGSENDTGSWIKDITILPSGELSEEWPGGFFTERLNEL
jgi:AAA15 family ATPase/GTPase